MGQNRAVQEQVCTLVKVRRLAPQVDAQPEQRQHGCRGQPFLPKGLCAQGLTCPYALTVVARPSQPPYGEGATCTVIISMSWYLWCWTEDA